MGRGDEYALVCDLPLESIKSFARIRQVRPFSLWSFPIPGVSQTNQSLLPSFSSDVRTFQARIAAMDRKHPDVGKYVRAEAATSNTYETLPLFACAVLAGAVARLPLEQQHKFALSYVGLRALYSVSSSHHCFPNERLAHFRFFVLQFLYVKITSKNASYIRSVVWLAGKLPRIDPSRKRMRLMRRNSRSQASFRSSTNSFNPENRSVNLTRLSQVTNTFRSERDLRFFRSDFFKIFIISSL